MSEPRPREDAPSAPQERDGTPARMASAATLPGDEQAVLRRRARALAHRVVPETDEEGMELLEFRIAGQAYALETCHVAEVVPLKHLTPVPGTPPFIAGVVNVRGRVVAALELRAFFDLPPAGLVDLHQLALIDAPGLALGLLVGQTLAVRRIALDRVHPVGATLAAGAQRFLRGMTAEQLLIIDAPAIVTDLRLRVDQPSRSPIQHCMP